MLTTLQQNIFNKIISQVVYNISTYGEDILDLTNRLLSISGAAGTGKSYLVSKITKQLLSKLKLLDFYSDGCSICITAPTHKAVQVVQNMINQEQILVECKTIHSFLGLIQIYDDETGEERYIVNYKATQNQPHTSILIVDESSMLSKQLYNFILNALEDGRVNTVLFVGDSYQLPPILCDKKVRF